MRLLFRPLPNFINYILLIAFPVTIAFAELPTYFGYLMPRLEKSLGKKWLAMLLPVTIPFHSALLPAFDI